ncbi:MAG: glycosyltransferase, partial [Candidatus Parvarchaeota archaeon]
MFDKSNNLNHLMNKVNYYMKILWLAHRDPLNPKAGGAEKIILEVGKRLVRKGYDITVFAGGWRNCSRHEYLEGIHIYRYGYRVLPHFILPVFLLKEDFDLVIADLGHAVPWIIPILLRKKTIVSFLHLHARSL